MGVGAAARKPAIACAGAVDEGEVAVIDELDPVDVAGLVFAVGWLPAIWEPRGVGRNIDSTTSVASPATSSGIRMRNTRGFMGILDFGFWILDCQSFCMPLDSAQSKIP